jgi:hypothetical protein
MKRKKNHIAACSKRQTTRLAAWLCLMQSELQWIFVYLPTAMVKLNSASQHLLFIRQHVHRLFISLITGLIFFVCVNSVSAAITKVQDVGSVNSTASSNSLTLNLSTTVTAGNSIIVTFVMDDAYGTITCTDSSGSNSYNVDVDQRQVNQARVVICSAHNVAALSTSDSISVNHPSQSHRAMSIMEFSGLATSVTTLDQTNSNTGNSTSLTSGSVTTTVDHELLIGAFGVNGPLGDNFTAGTDWTALPEEGTSGVALNPEYRRQIYRNRVFHPGHHQRHGFRRILFSPV